VGNKYSLYRQGTFQEAISNISFQ